MKLPKELEALILDYYWSHRIYELKVSLHSEIRHLWLLREVNLFYDVFYSPLNPYPEVGQPFLQPVL